MAYLKPPAFTRHLANPLAMRLSARGVATLTVVGCRTGELHKVPVIPVEVAGSRYLVSPYGESDWVRNLRAAGRGELSRKGQTEIFLAVEVPVDEREIVIARYREVAGNFVGPCFTKLPDPKHYPVFQVGALTRSRPSPKR
ncbi:MAG TPA: nitroreductase family deazaflavin-dependent oxidoreductase [Dermatophilaceae bacterium]|jgi:deazaflavin-dependent oxidoreductase (nitroreductase family)